MTKEPIETDQYSIYYHTSRSVAFASVSDRCIARHARAHTKPIFTAQGMTTISLSADVMPKTFHQLSNSITRTQSEDIVATSVGARRYAAIHEAEYPAAEITKPKNSAESGIAEVLATIACGDGQVR
jgi:hypothetical protein